ncbi:hypothetical protein [Micromonospora eburnea]|uniref:Uncharacterized protein n=1 Tax=Micromonospora eburnea TaxID=227316 RepID=A0A1C6TRS6_9ACTN|nr:hypothetical protein [Micromonospora eburnea]SCL44447.1 hypothetical protein GA0070604_0399 [Micromonospora eburnea]
MRDQDVLRAVADGLSGLDLDTPAEDIIAAGTSRRRRRLATVTVAGVLLAGLAVAVPALTGSGPAALPYAQGPASTAPAQLVAFSVVSNPNGTVTLKLSKKQLFDPDAARKALSEAGVPAEIRVDGSHCYSIPSPPELDRLFPSRSEADEGIVLVINPSAIPQGAVMTISYRDPSTDGPVSFGLAWKNRMTCK